MAEAHEHPRFVNSATYAVVVNVTVAGGARRRTAYRRAEKIAERLADTAARAADVVAVSAVTGPVGTDGEIICPTTVAFSRANTGAGRPGDEGKLTRYLDPDHERARASLVAADARYRAEQRADRERRRVVGCPNLQREPPSGGAGVRVRLLRPRLPLGGRPAALERAGRTTTVPVWRRGRHPGRTLPRPPGSRTDRSQRRSAEPARPRRPPRGHQQSVHRVGGRPMSLITATAVLLVTVRRLDRPSELHRLAPRCGHPHGSAVDAARDVPRWRCDQRRRRGGSC